MNLGTRTNWSGLLPLVGAAVLAGTSAVTHGQQAHVVGIGDFPHGTANIEQSIAFYRDVLGFELLSTRPPMAGGRMGANVYDARLQALMDVGGAYYRIAHLRIPGAGFRVQLVEMINNQHVIGARGRRQPSALHTERGGLMLRLPVIDVDRLFARIRDGVLGDVLTPGDGPVAAEPRRFVFRDETDGFLVEVVQARPGAPSGPAGSGSAGIVLTAANAEQKLRFYRDLLGFELHSGGWEHDPAAGDGASAGMVRRSVGRVPGTAVPFEIDEYRGISQRRFYPTTMGQDGVGWLQLLVTDLDGLMRRLIEERVWIVSTGLQPIAFDGSRRVVVRDPDGVFIELIEGQAGGSGQ
jgi:catechol 2,3-dioxygenase-like lactoylglutathione lyase family enzyme